MKLGVNVDHVATLRQARGTVYPDPVAAAMLAEYAGCDSIVMHLREDRRHICDRDVILVKRAVRIPFNLEMSTNKEIVDIALEIKPHQATLVPEKRRELTTEGGLDLIRGYNKVQRVVKRLQDGGIRVSLFLDPHKKQIEPAKKMGVDSVEINTGAFCEAKTAKASAQEIKKISAAAKFLKTLGIFAAAGHGIDYENVKEIIKIKEIEELNIGHSIICRAVFLGLTAAIEEMRELLKKR